MIESGPNLIKNTEVYNSLINDKEFNRIFESLKVNEKLSSDFIKFSDTLKIKYLIKIFLIIKKEKENLYNNFIELENEFKKLEIDNLIVVNQKKFKEDKLKRLKIKNEELIIELEDYKIKFNHLKSYNENYNRKGVQEINNCNKKEHLELNNKIIKNEKEINKFLNTNVINNNKIEPLKFIDKTQEKCLSKEEFKNINDGNLNIDFINFQVQKTLNHDDENFIADYIAKINSDSNDRYIHFDVEMKESIESNEKIKGNFNSQINQSISMYESVYESYDNKNNIGEYNSSSYQTLNSELKKKE